MDFMDCGSETFVTFPFLQLFHPLAVLSVWYQPTQSTCSYHVFTATKIVWTDWLYDSDGKKEACWLQHLSFVSWERRNGNIPSSNLHLFGYSSFLFSLNIMRIICSVMIWSFFFFPRERYCVHVFAGSVHFKPLLHWTYFLLMYE